MCSRTFYFFLLLQTKAVFSVGFSNKMDRIIICLVSLIAFKVQNIVYMWTYLKTVSRTVRYIFRIRLRIVLCTDGHQFFVAMRCSSDGTSDFFLSLVVDDSVNICMCTILSQKKSTHTKSHCLRVANTRDYHYSFSHGKRFQKLSGTQKI